MRRALRCVRPKLPRGLVLACCLLGASPPVWASYRDGFFGLVMLFFGVPSAVLLLCVAGFLRAAGLFGHRRWQRSFQVLVGLPAALVMVWVLFSDDGPSIAMVWFGFPLLTALATAPSWWRQPRAGLSFGAPTARLPRLLGLYWIVTALLPLIMNAGFFVRAQLPSEMLLIIAAQLLVFGLPRMVGGVRLLRGKPGVMPWLNVAVLVHALWMIQGLVAARFVWEGASTPLGMGFALLLVDGAAWYGVRRAAARQSP